jgi:hypothetical protein
MPQAQTIRQHAAFGNANDDCVRSVRAPRSKLLADDEITVYI